jgi:transcriptional regulator with XRE-family HTH domain
MSQTSPKQDALLLVLFKCGLTQKEAAKLLGVATITINRICQGTLALSEELATKMEQELDVAATWILANDDQAPIVTPRGGLWSKELYEFAQGSACLATEKMPGAKSVFFLSLRLRGRGPVRCLRRVYRLAFN